jgi:predicted kinase
MNKCYQLIGVPGSGKSTWIKNQEWTENMPIVSTDKFVEDYAIEQEKTYSDVFEEYMPIAVRLMTNHALTCQANYLDFVWDQTSTTVASRKRKFNTLLDSQYEHIAIVFKTPDEEELKRRLTSRPGKVIPWPVIQDMIDNFETPTEEEGFKEIWYAT